MKSIPRRKSAVCSLVFSLCLSAGPMPAGLILHASPNRNGAHSQKNSHQSRTGAFLETASHSNDGVLLEWQGGFSPDNLGFNIYRIEDGTRIKINSEVIPGFVFLPVEAGKSGTKSFAYLDRSGTPNSIYFIESVSTEGRTLSSEPVSPRASEQYGYSNPRQKNGLSQSNAAASGPSFSGQTSFPSAAEMISAPNGRIEDQWAVASQPGLKISINHDGWYRVTQQQVAAAGFSPSVDISYLLLYVDGQEVGIRTSKASGPFVNGDYIEFYGRGLDLPTTDSRTYYLLAGNRAGNRVTSELRADSSLVIPAPVSVPAPQQATIPFSRYTTLVWYQYLLNFLTGANNELATSAGAESKKPTKETAAPRLDGQTKAEPPRSLSATTRTSQTKRKRKSREGSTPARFNHAALPTSPQNFTSTVERKDRLVYFVTVLNGDAENYFGQVISSSPVSQTLVTQNPDSAAVGSARLEVALQGVGTSPHQIEVRFNDVLLGTMNFFGIAHLVQRFDVPAALLNNGSNTLKFTSLISSTVCIADYARLTYSHAFLANNDSLRLSLRPTQSVIIDGFSTPNIRLIDYTDPFSVRLSKPITAPSGAGYSISVESLSSRAKARLLYALPDTQVETPAALSLNQPSTLNLSSNGADLLIIAHKSLISSAAPLVALRQTEGLQVSVVDVEDVYDEFSYGVHGPQAVKDFLSRAYTSWTRPPRYVILLGDASLDPRNYQNAGNFDLVPTKLLDATFSETASDDWLSDFNNDGLPEIPLGRLPVRTSAQANLTISKIVNFSPAKVPQSALLVADDPTGYYFNFETANDQVQSLLPAGFGVQRINRRTDPDPRTNLITKFNSGQALVNYTGHGNVDTWTGANILTATDASKLTNAVSVVLSQIYGGGGEPGATLRNDYVEIFNRGGWPVNLNGWSLQYASASGSSWQVTNLPNVVIPPGKYFLVQEAQGPGGTTALPAPDAIGTIDIDATAGNVALVNSTTALSGSGCPLGTNVVDLVGYGAANCSQGSPAPGLTATTAAVRSANGCANTNSNSADFSAAAPAPRNSAAAANICINSSDRLPLSFVVVMDCLNGYFQDPFLQGMAEALMNAPNGGSVAAFASSGLTVPDGQHAMAQQLYTLLYGSQSVPLGDAIRTAKAATTDIDVRHTWIFFGDPSMKIR